MPRNSSASLTLRQFQSESDAIREAPVPATPRYAIWILAAFIVSGVVVTSIAKVDRVVTSEAGTIVPTKAVNVFQALDPSIIKTIDVKEGQEVKAGDLLATLDQTFAAADVTQLKEQIASLDALVERAEAELAGRVPQFTKSTDPKYVRYSAIQNALFEQRRGQYRAQVASFEAKIAQTQSTIVKLQNDETRYGEREKISKQIETMRSTLVEHQVGSLLNLLGSQDQRIEILRTMEENHNSLIESQHLLASLKADEEAFKQQWSVTTSQDLVTARNTRDGAIAALGKAAKHQDLVKLFAPEDAVVLTVAKLSVGSVLKQGDSFMTLMPLNTPLEAEVHINSRDIGFLRAGDKATLKIDAFDSAEHGTADGHVTWISDGSFTADDSGKPVDPFYKAHIAIDAVHFTGVPHNFRFVPGMTLTADVNVGSRSLARYLIGGAMRGIGESMREP